MKYIGTKLDGIEYQERRTAYVLIFNNDGKIAITYENGEIYNMIGGKIEDGENAAGEIVENVDFGWEDYQMCLELIKERNKSIQGISTDDSSR